MSLVVLEQLSELAPLLYTELDGDDPAPVRTLHIKDYVQDDPSIADRHSAFATVVTLKPNANFLQRDREIGINR